MEMGVGTTGLGDSDRKTGLSLDFAMDSAANVDDRRREGDILVVLGARLAFVVGDLGGSFSSSEKTKTSSRVVKASEGGVQSRSAGSVSSCSSSEVSTLNLASGCNGTIVVRSWDRRLLRFCPCESLLDPLRLDGGVRSPAKESTLYSDS